MPPFYTISPSTGWTSTVSSGVETISFLTVGSYTIIPSQNLSMNYIVVGGGAGGGMMVVVVVVKHNLEHFP